MKNYIWQSAMMAWDSMFQKPALERRMVRALD